MIGQKETVLEWKVVLPQFLPGLGTLGDSPYLKRIVVAAIPPDDFGDYRGVEMRELTSELSESLALLVAEPDPPLGLLAYSDRSFVDMAFERCYRVAIATSVRFPFLPILIDRRLHRQRGRPHRLLGATVADYLDALIAVLVRFCEPFDRQLAARNSLPDSEMPLLHCQ